MKFWGRKTDAGRSTDPAEQVSAEAGDANQQEEHQSVEGERGVPPQSAFRSVQSRVSSVLTITLMVILSAGLLTWYYANAIGRGAKVRSSALAAQQRKAQGESALPPFTTFHLPRGSSNGPGAQLDSRHVVATPTLDGANTSGQQSPMERILGEAPEAPELPVGPPQSTLGSGNVYGAYSNGAPPLPKTPAQLLLDRRLSGPVLSHAGESTDTAPRDGDETNAQAAGVSFSQSGAGAPGSQSSSQTRENGDRPASSLQSLLQTTETPAVSARVLPTQRYLLPKGAFIDCTLETAISSSLPGMTTCITATDTFSVDGSIVLLERGTKLTGETRGTVQAGSPRLFVLWNEARTPGGIVVPLASPGTDELGRSGLSGTIDWHWWQRFGSAVLITVLDGAVQGITNRSNSSTVQINPSGSTEVIEEALRGSIAIPPTIDKPQGDRIEILVARDVDFRSVYELRARPAGGK